MDGTLVAAVAEHKPAAVFALFSGGNDSLCSTHFAMSRGAQRVVHVNTGIGVEETREFVRETCRKYGWPLTELHPPAMTYRDFVLKYGFPGPGAHRYAYSWLKERALRGLVRSVKQSRRDRVMLVTGVRRRESARRMGYVQPVIRMGAIVWVAPLYSFSKLDIADYKKANGLPHNPVTSVLGMSGECLCGAFAQPGEMQKIEKHYPATAGQIRALECEARMAGVHCSWGTKPTKAKDLDQYEIPWMPLCSGCPGGK